MTKTIRWFAALLVLLAASSAAAAEKSARNCTAIEKTAANKQLWLNKRDKQLSIARALPWGVPQGQTANETILVQRDYVINYDTDLRVPIWTAHQIDIKRFRKIERINCFRRDPRIAAPAASLPADYAEPIFDQGHLTPNGDMGYSVNAVINSFVMSNMTPQYCQFNRGVWQILESMVRLWASDAKTLYVITGSIFDRDANNERDPDANAKRMKSNNGKSRVAIPTHFYKILVRKAQGDSIEALAIVMPNDQTDLDGQAAADYIAAHVKPIANIEGVTGLKFFPTLSTPPRESQGLWPYAGKPARTLVSAACRKTAGADN